jgi:hypothetical protein
MDLRRIIRTPGGDLCVATLAVLILAVLAAVLGLAALGGWAGTLGIAVVVTACIAAMIRYGDG